MPGLLDAFNDPQFQRGLMMFAASMPQSEQSRAGLLSYVDKQEEAKARREYMQLQMEGQRGQNEANKAKTAAAQAKLDFDNNLFGALMGGGQPQGAGFAPGSVAPDGSRPNAGQGGFIAGLTPDQLAALSMRGHDFTKQYELTRPDMQVANGYAYDKRTLAPGFMPSLQTTADGKSTMTQIGPNGMPIVSAPQGALGTYGDYKGVDARIAAENELVKVPFPNGSTQTMLRSDAQRLLAGGAGGQRLGGLGTEQSPADKVYTEGAAKSAQEQYQGMQSAGMKAPGMMAKLDQIGALLSDHDGSKLSPTGLQLAQMANSFGLKVDKNLGNKEAAQALVNEMALSLRSTADGGGMPGALSNSDRDFLVSMVPGLTQSAAGRQKLIEATKATYQRQIDVARMGRMWQQRYGRIDAPNPTTGKTFYDNLQEWSERNPLFSE